MNTVGDVFAIIFLEGPLLILTWILIKITRDIFYRMKSVEYNGGNKFKSIIKIIILSGIISTLLTSGGYFLILIFFPGILSATPLALRLFFLFLILIVYGCFTAIFMGLGDVVGAGGSAGEVLKTLSTYLRETFQTKKP